MRLSPVLATSAAFVLAAGVCAPAAAGAEPGAAAGVAESRVTLLELAAGGHALTAGSLALLSDTVAASPTARIVATPLRLDGTAYGERAVTPADSPKDVPSLSSAGRVPAVDGVAALTSPALRLSADTASGAATRAGTTSLGGASVLGLPIALDGTLELGSVVTSTEGAATKTLRVTDLALPSIADLLGALQLDLSLLPVDVLRELVTALDLVTTTVRDAEAALEAAAADLAAQTDAAQAEVDAQVRAVAAAAQTLTEAQGSLDTAEQELATAEQAATALLPLDLALEEALALSPAELALLPADLQAALTDVTEARTATAAAQAAVGAAQLAVDAAQVLLDAARAALAALLGTLTDELAALEAALLAVLDDTPLVSIDALEVSTAARVTSAAAGGQSAEVVGGEVEGLRVLGTDVLADVLGSSRLEVLQLTGDTLTRVEAAVGALTGTLSEVLSTVPGLPELSVPAPQIDLLTRTTDTGTADGFGTASTGLRALSVTLPPLTLPGVIGGAPTASAVTTSPVSLTVGALTDVVRFRPAGAPATVTPPTRTTAAPTGTTSATRTAAPTRTVASTRELAATGTSGLLGGLGLLLVGGAALVRRRTAAGSSPDSAA